MKADKYRIIQLEYNNGEVVFKIQVKTFLRWRDANLYGIAVYPSKSIETGYSYEHHSLSEAEAKLREREGNQVKKIQVVRMK